MHYNYLPVELGLVILVETKVLVVVRSIESSIDGVAKIIDWLVNEAMSTALVDGVATGNNSSNTVVVYDATTVDDSVSAIEFEDGPLIK